MYRRSSVVNLLLWSLLCLIASQFAQASILDDPNEPTPEQMRMSSQIYSIYPKNGLSSGGTLIRVSGKNLYPTMTIRLGGGLCTNVKLIAPNTLQCRAPAHAPGIVALIVQKTQVVFRMPKVFTYVSDLILNPSVLGVDFGGKASFSAVGGIPPYTFSILQGSAQIDPKTGVIQAPPGYDVGIAQVTDSTNFTSVAGYRSSPKLRVYPESADIETDTDLSISGLGGEPPYEMDLIDGDGKFFPDRRSYISSSLPGKATIRLIDSINNKVDLHITIHPRALMPGRLVAAGDEDSCALSDEHVNCWGANRLQKTQISKVAVTDKAVPVAQLFRGVTSIVSGAHHKCVLKSGQVYCWGSNQYGQLGIGSTNPALTPTPVVGLESGVRAIAAGSFHTCAALDHAVACWGRNESGQLGDLTTLDNPFPVAVHLKGKITGIAGGATHSCAIADGMLWCWGKNESGQLGTPDKLDSTVPVKVSSIGNDVRFISAGRSSSCAAGPGYLKCWGFRGISNQGQNTKQTNETTVPYSVQVPGEITALSSQQYHSCAIADGEVYCWGYNYQGQVGDTSHDNRWTPSHVSGLPGKVADVAAGESHTCAAMITGAIYCWGDNYFGELGNGATSQQVTPVLVIPRTPKKPQQ
jgi:alpha-tubulin suppressor-like RCC1 family protein